MIKPTKGERTNESKKAFQKPNVLPAPIPPTISAKNPNDKKRSYQSGEFLRVVRIEKNKAHPPNTFSRASFLIPSFGVNSNI